MRLLLSGGGTGGHVYPALAVAAHVPSAVAAAGGAEHDAALFWAGSSDGIEQGLVTSAHIPFHAIPTGQLRGTRLLTAARNTGRIALGLTRSLALVREIRPDVCLVTGGYVCVPVALACRLRRVPLMIYLPDITPGLAVRWLSLLAQKVAVSFPEAAPFFGAKSVVTGYPVRPALVAAAEDRARARRRLARALASDWQSTGPGLTGPEVEGADTEGAALPLLLVFGGSQGARSINRALWSILADLLPLARVLHIVGTRDWPLWEETDLALPAELAARYHPVPYLDDAMAWALAGADLVVARAGASTLGEFPVAGLPAVLVPLPIAGGHQMANARVLADAGAATIVEDGALTAQLLPTLRTCLLDGARRRRMEMAMRSLARPGAARHIAAELVKMGMNAPQMAWDGQYV